MHSNQNKLYHHGVLGMKWGVRRSSSRGVGTTGRKIRKDTRSEDAKSVAPLKKKKVHQLSNSEIRKVNERSQLEQQYSHLNPSKVKKGIKFIAGAGSLMGTILTVYNNSNNLVKLGSTLVNKHAKAKYIKVH